MRIDIATSLLSPIVCSVRFIVCSGLSHFCRSTASTVPDFEDFPVLFAAVDGLAGVVDR
jgi:hypothetical protein